MKKVISLLLAFMLLSTLAIGCVGCNTNINDNDKNTNDVTDNDVKASVTLSKTELQLKVGEQAIVSATVIPTGAKITWSSSNESVAIVSGGGNVVALSEGKAVITASVSQGEATATCTVTVTKAEESVSITLSKTQLEMFVGDSETLSAMVLPADSKIKVEWSSSNTNAVIVKDGTLQAIATGTSFIQAKAGNATAVCTVEVKEAFGSISGTITCYNKDTKKYEVDVQTFLYLVSKETLASKDAVDINLMGMIRGESFDRDGIYRAQVDALGNYKFENIKIGEYRMIIICRGRVFWTDEYDATQRANYANAVKKAFGDVYNRGTADSKTSVDELWFGPRMQGFNVKVGKEPLTIVRAIADVGAGTDVL